MMHLGFDIHFIASRYGGFLLAVVDHVCTIPGKGTSDHCFLPYLVKRILSKTCDRDLR